MSLMAKQARQSRWGKVAAVTVSTILVLALSTAPVTAAPGSSGRGDLSGPTGTCSQYSPGEIVGLASLRATRRSPTQGSVDVIVVAEHVRPGQRYDVSLAETVQESVGGVPSVGCRMTLVGSTASVDGRIRFHGEASFSRGDHAFQVFVGPQGQFGNGYSTGLIVVRVP